MGTRDIRRIGGIICKLYPVGSIKACQFIFIKSDLIDGIFLYKVIAFQLNDHISVHILVVADICHGGELV